MTLAEWEAKWTLNGDHLYCNGCRLAQWPYNAAHPFLHDRNCPALRAEPEYPWRDLARIVSTASDR